MIRLPHFIISALTLLFSFYAAGEVSINLPTEGTFSTWEGLLTGDVNSTTTTIYGGTAGPACSSTSTNSTCNNCNGVEDGDACNTTRIHDDLVFEVTLNFPSGEPGEVQVQTNDNTDTRLETAPGTTVGSNIQPGEGNLVIVRVTWGEICKVVFKATTTPYCENVTDNTTRTILFGIFNGTNFDSTPELRFQVGGMSTGETPVCQDGGGAAGACNFIAYPGDSKVFIEQVRTGSSLPNSPDSNLNVTHLRVFRTVDEGEWPTIASEFNDLEISEASAGQITLTKNTVEGLANDTRYRFAIGIVDQANNVGYVTDMESPATDDPESNAGCFEGTDAEWTQNCHIATPSEVIGLIQDEFDCFIATATYGTPFQPRVKDLRAFRNRYLNTHVIGRFLVKTYYQISPPLAQWIQKNPRSKPFVHAVLTPFWWFAKLSLKSPLAALSMLLFGFVAVITLFFKRRQHS